MIAPDHRQRVVDLCVELSRRGYLAATGGNVALRIDSRCFAITPSATDYLAMRADDVCVMHLPELVQIAGHRAPSVETDLHARLLRRRPDVQCSIHTHQPVASAWALLGEELDVDEPGARQSIGERVPLIGYMPSGTSLLAGLVEHALQPGINAYLMRNHGVLCCGTSVDAAMQAVEDLERLARRRLRTVIAARAAEPSRAAALERVLAALEIPGVPNSLSEKAE